MKPFLQIWFGFQELPIATGRHHAGIAKPSRQCKLCNARVWGEARHLVLEVKQVCMPTYSCTQVIYVLPITGVRALLMDRDHWKGFLNVRLLQCLIFLSLPWGGACNQT